VADDFSGNQRSPQGPYTKAVAVTPNDSTDLADVASALYIGGAGAVKVTTAGGTDVTLSGALVGTILPVRVTRVWSTGTTATNIVALR
jgi:hypothetical protein